MADKNSLTLAQVTALVKLAKKVDQFNNLLSGNGPPSDNGTNGDWYVDVLTKRLYGPKTETGWAGQPVAIGTSDETGTPRPTAPRTALNADGTLAAGTYGLYILSPDLRQDDKPRVDKPFVVPADSVVYRTAISAPGVKEATVAGTTTIKLETLGANAPATGTLTAEADGYYPEDGVSSALKSIVDGTAVSTSVDTAVEVTTNADLVASLDPSAGACRNSPSAILVEVCYYRAAPAPDTEDAHIPFAVEAGQGY